MGVGSRGVGVGEPRGTGDPADHWESMQEKFGEDAISAEICKGPSRAIEIFTKHSQKPLWLPKIPYLYMAHCCLTN